MRRFLSIVGAIALALLVIGTAGFGYVARKGEFLDAESKAFVDDAVPAIAKDWNQKALMDRATPALAGSVSPDVMTANFFALQALGSMVAYDGAKGQSNMSFVLGSGATISASYIAGVRCRNGAAVFRLSLLRRDGRWQIDGFHIDPVPGSMPERHAAADIARLRL